MLPRIIGIFPETKKDIIASIGPYGPYLKHNNKFISLKEDDVTEIGINRAIELIQKNIDERKEFYRIHPELKKDIIQKKELRADQTIFLLIKRITLFLKNMDEKKCHLEDAIKILNNKLKKSTKKKLVKFFFKNKL